MGLPEIEINLAQTGGILSSVAVRDTDGAADRYTLGAGGVNLNATESTSPDADLTGFLAFSFAVDGSAGADIFDARGGAGTGAVFTERLEFTGGPGNDQLFGGDDSDDLDGGPGNDTLAGGAGRDEVDYSTSTLPVSFDLLAGGAQNGGSLGQDILSGIEDITGTPFNDVLRGTAGENSLDGEAGDDLIEGRGEATASLATVGSTPSPTRVPLHG